jgi:hypothetical protein
LRPSCAQDFAASLDLDVLGLCELVGWADDGDALAKAPLNSLSKLAGRAGFPYAKMLRADTYHLGECCVVTAGRRRALPVPTPCPLVPSQA